MSEIPESDETLEARGVLFDVLAADMVGDAPQVVDAVAALIEAKITDAIEFMADRLDLQIAAIRNPLPPEKSNDK